MVALRSQTCFSDSVVAEDMADENPIDRARERQRERAAHVESIVASVERDIDADAYPVRSEELVTAYADEPLAVSDEAESLGRVFDRLETEEYRSPTDIREALVDELSASDSGDAERSEVRDEVRTHDRADEDRRDR